MPIDPMLQPARRNPPRDDPGAAGPPGMARGRGGLNASADSATRALELGIVILVGAVLPTCVAWVLDTRELRGVNVWDKPLKFELSLALHLATLRLATALLPAALATGERAWCRRAVLAVTFCSIAELAYIALQAARGRESHFNRETPLEAFLYFGAMGSGALVIVGGSAVLGFVLWHRARRGPASGLAYGMALGLIAGSALTLVAVVPLSSGIVDGLGHWVGGVRTDAGGMPFTGWSTTGGDLRVPHFFATHLMQAVPLAGWLADRLAPTQARAWPRIAVAAGAAAVLLTLLQAVSGQPLWLPFTA